ncbi:MAG: hypothetical protein Q9162_005679 [Coniocarpon cinnabarinum]
MANRDYYNDTSFSNNHYGYAEAQSPPKAYTPEDLNKPVPYRPVSPLGPHDSHSSWNSQPALHYASSHRDTPSSFHRHDSDPSMLSDQIPLQKQQPKTEDGNGSYPPGYGLTRQESDSFLIAQEEQRPYDKNKKKKPKKFDWTRIPYVVYVVSFIQIIVFIAELVKMSNLTGSPIMTKPYVNPMLGPSPNVLINMGARYVACMRNQVGVQDQGVTLFPCPNATSNAADGASCSLTELCGFTSSYPVPNPNPALKGQAGLEQSPAPNQWFRFITPIFLHGGFIHIASNLLLQLFVARDMERAIGSIRFGLVYFSAGIFGFVFGGDYAQSGIASTDRSNPWFDLFTLLATVVIEIVIGLLPTGLDNFSHIGGLLVGLVLGVCLLHSPNALRKQIGMEQIPFKRSKKGRRKSKPIGATQIVYGTTGTDATKFLKNPSAFFRDRKPLWWVWWIFRAAALVAILVGFILIIKNFYNTHESNCHWCQYMSCIDHDHWCQKYNLGQTTQTVSSGPSQTGSARLML